jgi:hypothetical protein
VRRCDVPGADGTEFRRADRGERVELRGAEVRAGEDPFGAEAGLTSGVTVVAPFSVLVFPLAVDALNLTVWVQARWRALGLTDRVVPG